MSKRISRRSAIIAAPTFSPASTEVFAQRGTAAQVDEYADLKIKLAGLLKPGQGLYRNTLLDAMYASLPRDSQAKVWVYNYEIAPKASTNWHAHNGATFFIALQGMFEATFQEGVLVKAKAGDVYSEPVAKMHQGTNPHPELSNLGIGIQFTAPDREHLTTATARPW